ncbi:MAG TPA: methyltransferase C-terminal domain-containing protein, partial [Thermoanaerobaculia bacterium]|nr:methyltransferase C-terminal domain-containing protein [Thermoanaerobaculia bacterium]
LDAFMEGVDTLLSADGILVIEAPYFVNLLDACEYDTIYHEHLSYLSIGPMRRFFERTGFELFDVVERDIHGGSIRVFVGRPGIHPVSASVAAAVEREVQTGAMDLDRLSAFAAEVARNRAELTTLLFELRRAGHRIAGIGAPAKGMTLLNYCRIGPETLDFVTEKAQLKIGRFTPGTHIPVLPDSELLRQKPQYGLLLAWNFAEEIMNNLKDYRAAGGRFIIPIPHPRIVE